MARQNAKKPFADAFLYKPCPCKKPADFLQLLQMRFAAKNYGMIMKWAFQAFALYLRVVVLWSSRK